MKSKVFFAVVIFICGSCSLYAQGFQWRERKDASKLELLYNGKVLTAYCYFDSTEKPVLFPIRTITGKTVTRGYPIAPRAGERTDHPHHAGLWFNYESVNGLDFWNNSFAIPAERKHLYGTIRHKEILSHKASGHKASLSTVSSWVDKDGNVLMTEQTQFSFQIKGNDFIIDRMATLEAVAQEVVFKDVKDGLLGLRVARALEMPSKQQDKFVDAMGNETTVAATNNEGVTGMYVNAQGIKGDAVWSTRSEWVVLSGKLEGETVSVAMIDHKTNIGYPTYWHARGYGLFAANPLGAKIFSEGKSEVNLVLKKGEEKKFQYRIVIHSGDEITSEVMNKLAGDFNRK
jgi:hypothetical protein